MRRLLTQIDDAARGAGTEALRRRALQNLHFLSGEAVAHIDAEIAQTIDVEIALGFGSRGCGTGRRAKPPPPSPMGDGDARNVAQRLLDRC